MDLRDLVIRRKPREQAGPRSADRFDYEKDWAICRLLILHESGNAYLIAFDIFDDVVVLNSAAEPDSISFFQVKTRENPPMRMSDMIRRKDGKNGPLPSMLGKLYSNKIAFPDHTRTLTLVSNVPFDVRLCDGAKSTSKQSLCCNELNQHSRAAVARQLKEEHALTEEPAFADFTYLEVSDLPLRGHDTHTRGKLAEFLERLNPSGTFKVSLVYRTIADEVKRKNNYHADVNTFDAFIREKAIGRTAFTEILRRVGAYEDFDAMWARIEGRLNSEGAPVFTIRRLRDEFRRFVIDRLSKTESAFQRLEDYMRHLVAAAEAEGAGAGPALLPLLDAFVQAIRTDAHAADYLRYADDYIKAVGLALLYGQ